MITAKSYNLMLHIESCINPDIIGTKHANWEHKRSNSAILSYTQLRTGYEKIKNDLEKEVFKDVPYQ